MTGGRLSGRTLHALAAIVLCAELVGTIAFLTGDGDGDGGPQQVVEAAPAPTPVPPRPFMLAR